LTQTLNLAEIIKAIPYTILYRNECRFFCSFILPSPGVDGWFWVTVHYTTEFFSIC